MARTLNMVRSIIRLMMINMNRLRMVTVYIIRSCVRTMMMGNRGRVWVRMRITLKQNRIECQVGD